LEKITLVIQKKNEGETEKRVAAQRKLLLLQVEGRTKNKIKNQNSFKYNDARGN
jgi:hypothetical protein